MPKHVTITYSPFWGEYRVPGPDNTGAQVCYTPDKEDAEYTAQAIYGDDVVITHEIRED